MGAHAFNTFWNFFGGDLLCRHARKQCKEFAMKKIIFASAFAAALAMGFPLAAEAGSNAKDFFDRNEIGDPYGCYDCYPRFGVYHGRLSCGEARARVRHSGFRNVSTIECRGSTYTFEATRRGRDVTVYVNARNGAIWRR
jgi:hypothetical protein